MAAQQQPMDLQALTDCTVARTCLSPERLSRQNSVTVGVNRAILRADDEVAKTELKHEAARRALFQKESNEMLDMPNGYQKVEVLIIRWDESIDDFSGHGKEVLYHHDVGQPALTNDQYRSSDCRLFSRPASITAVRWRRSRLAETHRSI
jgi:hypothetical protein